MGDKKTKSKGISSYKKKRTKSKKIRKRTPTKRKSNSKQRTIEKQRKIIAKQNIIISNQRKTLKKQRKKLSAKLSGGGGTRAQKKKKTRAQNQREFRRRKRREAKREEDFQKYEEDISPLSIDNVQGVFSEEEEEGQEEEEAEEETPSISEPWKKLQTSVFSKSPELFPQEEEIQSDEELERELQLADDLIRKQGLEEKDYDTQERDVERLPEVVSEITSPALRLSDEILSSDSEYESDVTQEGDPRGFIPHDTESESEYETDSDTSSVISQEDPELQEFESFGRDKEESEDEDEDDEELTIFAQPYGLTAPKNPTDIQSLEPKGQTLQKTTTYSSEKPGKIASTFQKLKSVFSSPDYEQLLKTNSEELKALYISYLNEHFDDIKEGEDVDKIKENYVNFVNQYYKEAFQKDKLLLEKLKDA